MDKEDWEDEVNSVKLKERSELKLREWSISNFATKRAAEVEAAVNRLYGMPLRYEARNLSYEDFSKLEIENRVVLISGIPDEWSPRDWSYSGLLKSFGEEKFKVGKDDHGTTLKLKLKTYMKYVERQTDDSPLYVFDSNLGGKAVKAQIASSYTVPRYFPDDMFACLDDRPPYRWFLAGPKRSGTCVHIDPLQTSAWNTLLVGRKKWAFLHPDVSKKVAKGRTVLKPGEDDEAINFFVDIIPRLRAQGVEVFELIQEQGETIFVPGGWWHCVMNITDTVGVTQNYCGRHNFDNVWRSARVERPCMSVKWLQKMAAVMPGWAERARDLDRRDGFDLNAGLEKNRRRRNERRYRRKARACSKAAQRAKKRNVAFDGQKWERNYCPSSSSHSDSTVSTTSSESSSSSESATDSSLSSVTSSETSR
ncbi:Bifunctional arginine demethylase and lysyl-hydroxylase PSR [Diplonema papillatum]|nr:Bifunctional arginine demethylase and lysyl-hydroxylase PSR [Diplonema papillatum]